MSENKVGWLAVVGAVLLFLALIGLIIVFRRSRTMVLPTRRKWEIHKQVQLKRDLVIYQGAERASGMRGW